MSKAMDGLEPWDPLDHPARIEIRRQESEDSDAEGGLGNVTRVVLRPPGHSGKAKRGHLSFDASFESGNLGRVDFISEFEYDLFIRPDTCNPRYRLWFNFVVDNVRADQRVIFNIVNLCKTKTLFSQGMTPLVKTSSRPKWQRLGGKYVYYHKSAEHRHHYVLSFAFLFDRESDVYQFALTFPYSYSRAQTHLTALAQLSLPHLHMTTLAQSLQGRNVDVITIANPSLIATGTGKRPKVVVIMARSHPGESPTSFIAQGLLDFLGSSHILASILRDHVIIKVIPMLNPDGVFMGNYRSSVMGYDLNRHWNQVSPWAHPVLHAVKTFLTQLDTNKATELDMVIDLHAHTSLLGTFIYGNSYDDVYRFERHILFPKLLAHNAEDYNASYTMYNRDPSKVGTARRHLCEILRNTVNVYTLEVSMLGYTGVNNSTVNYNEDSYFRLGRNLVRTLVEYYKVTGVILPSAFPAVTPAQAGGDDGKKKGITRSSSRPSPKPRQDSRAEGENRRVVELDKLTRVGSEDGGTGSEYSQSPEPSLNNSGDPMRTPPTTRRDGPLPSNGPKPLPPKKPTYTTFDFSQIKGSEGEGVRTGVRFRRHRGTGRKVGGGGVMGKRKERDREWKRLHPIMPLEPPSLTIIDFNLFLRAGLESRIQARAAKVQASATDREERRRKRVRRRRATLLRGTVTDCSAWEDTATSGSDWEEAGIRAKLRSAPASPKRELTNEKMKLCPREAWPRFKGQPVPGS